MKEKVLISVIVPVYNVEDYVEDCLNSILRQSYRNFELIVIDDGSPDNSGVICDRVASKDSRVKVFHQKNSGVSKARRCGLEHSCGDYITFVDSDDLLAQDALCYWLEIAMRDKAELVITPCSGIVDGYAVRLKMRTRGVFNRFGYRKILGRGLISPGIGGKFFARKLFDEDTLSMSKEIKNNEDLLMNFRLSKKLNIVSCCPLKSVYFCNARENSASNTKLPESSWVIFYDAMLSLPEEYQKAVSSYLSRSLLQRYENREVSIQLSKEILNKRTKIDNADVLGLLIDKYLLHPSACKYQLYIWTLRLMMLFKYIYVYGLHSWQSKIVVR